MKFYIYPLEPIEIEKLSPVHFYFFNLWVEKSYTTLCNHTHRVKNPEDADYFIISFTLITFKFVKYNLEMINKKIKSLKYIDSGKPHIVFDFSNHNYPIYENKDLYYFKTSCDSRTHNFNKHICIPLFPLYMFPDEELEESEDRLVLCSFRGDLKNELRKDLIKYNSVELIIKDETIRELDLSEDMEYKILNHENLESYVNLLYNSKFTILPRGSSVGLSYRLIESMSTGSIPVIISDYHVLPFSDMINYNKFSIKIKEKSIKNLEKKLNKINNLNELQNNLVVIYNIYFSTIEKIISTALTIFEIKFI
jgi:hypothetical protein